MSRLFADLIDAKGDLLAGTDASQIERLPVGDNGQVLTADSTAPTGLAWETPSGAGGGISETIIDAKGDLIVGSAADTAAKLPVGNDGEILMANSDAAEGVAWTVNYADKVYVYVKNNTGTTLAKGAAVYISGSDGNNALISLADADLEGSSSKTLGLLVQELAQGDHGYVITNGLLAGIDTNSATAGDAVWLSTTAGGRVYGTPPAKPAHAVYLGVVTRVSATVGELEVKVQNGYELQELHDVASGEVADGDILRYNTATSLWEHSSALVDHIAAADPHPGYVLESIVDAKGDLIAGSAADTVIRLAVGTNGQVLVADSSTGSGLAWGSRGADVQIFSSSGTWNKPAGASVAYIFAVGGGGGGQSGVGPAAGSPYGGGGGAGAISVVRIIPISELGETETVTIGAGGAGGASISSGTSINNGITGSATTFGSWISADGGIGYSTGNVSTVGRVMVATSATSSASPAADGPGVAPSTTTTTGPTGKRGYYGPGGGGAGGLSSSTVVATGGTGGGGFMKASGGAGASVAGANGTAGPNFGDGGGAGTGSAGNTSPAVAGGNGGNGAIGGGGGGGGGGGRTISSVAYASGKGGDGGNGYCLVISF